MSETTNSEVPNPGSSCNAISEVEGEWHNINWFVFDVDAAWDCALDIEAWLKVRYAGNGRVEHISGQEGQIGVGYLHNEPASGQSPDISIYHLKDIDPEALRLTFRVQTDLASFRTPTAERTCTLHISRVPRASGLYQVQLSEDGCNKKWIKHHRQPRILNQYHGVAFALSGHFLRYANRNSRGGVVAALPIE